MACLSNCDGLVRHVHGVVDAGDAAQGVGIARFALLHAAVIFQCLFIAAGSPFQQAGHQQDANRIGIQALRGGQAALRLVQPLAVRDRLIFLNLRFGEGRGREGGARVQPRGFLEQRDGLLEAAAIAAQIIEAAEIRARGGGVQRFGAARAAEPQCGGDRAGESDRQVGQGGGSVGAGELAHLDLGVEVEDCSVDQPPLALVPQCCLERVSGVEDIARLIGIVNPLVHGVGGSDHHEGGTRALQSADALRCFLERAAAGHVGSGGRIQRQNRQADVGRVQAQHHRTANPRYGGADGREREHDAGGHERRLRTRLLLDARQHFGSVGTVCRRRTEAGHHRPIPAGAQSRDASAGRRGVRAGTQAGRQFVEHHAEGVNVACSWWPSPRATIRAPYSVACRDRRRSPRSRPRVQNR